MKKIFAILSIFLLVVALLLAGSAFYLSYFVNPNKFKGRISQYVFAKTGQVLVINGNIQWSVFPWVGLKAKNLVYYNSPNFMPKVFISAKEMDIKVKFMPLLKRKVEVGNITLNGAIFNLTKNRNGEFNWQAIAKQNKKTRTRQENIHFNTLSNMSIGSLKIKNGKIHWLDQSEDSKVTITALNVSSTDLRFGKPFPLSVRFDLEKSKDKNLKLQLDADILVPINHHQYQLSSINLKGHYDDDNSKINIKLNGNLAADLLKETLLAKFNFTVNDINGKLALSKNDLSEQSIKGVLSIDDFNAKQLLQDLGTPINFQNNNALKSVSLISKLEMTKDSLQLNQLHANIDKTDVYGNINYSQKGKALHFSLNANQIQLNDYLLKAEKTSKNDTKDEAPAKKNEASHSSPLAMNGIIKVANLATGKLKLSNLNANITSKNNVLRILPLQASFYNGKINGNVIIDKSRPNQTIIATKQTITNLDIKKLFHEFSNADKLKGNTNLSLDLTSTISANKNFLSALNGKVRLTLAGGALKGVDIIYQLSRVHSFIKHLPRPSLSDTKQTAFTLLSADAAVANGILTTENLSLTSDYLKVNGKGSTNLNTKEIRYHLNALAQPKLAEKNHEIGKEVTIYQVPIKISGSLSKPSVNLDFIEIAKIFFTKEIEKPISKHLGKAINNVKHNLKEQVQNKLKDYSAPKILDKLILKDKSSHNAPASPSQSDK